MYISSFLLNSETEVIGCQIHTVVSVHGIWFEIDIPRFRYCKWLNIYSSDYIISENGDCFLHFCVLKPVVEQLNIGKRNVRDF